MIEAARRLLLLADRSGGLEHLAKGRAIDLEVTLLPLLPAEIGFPVDEFLEIEKDGVAHVCTHVVLLADPGRVVWGAFIGDSRWNLGSAGKNPSQPGGHPRRHVEGAYRPAGERIEAFARGLS